MNTTLLIKLHERSIWYLKQYRDCENRVNDIGERYEVQFNLDENDIRRFLNVPSSWYIREYARYVNLLDYIDKRYNINCACISFHIREK